MAACERLMRRGEVRLLLCHHHDRAPAELDARAFVRCPLKRDRLVPVSAPDDQGRLRYPLPMQAGQAAPYLAYREESGLGRILRRSGVLERLHGQLAPAFHSHAALTLASLARSGRGLAWVPLSLVRSDLDRGALVQADDPETGIDIAVCLIRSAARQSPAVESLWSLAQAEARG
jgi:DNA-binding transcriptional LysR family regulator